MVVGKAFARRLCLVVAVAFLVTAATSGPAAAHGWTAQPTPQLTPPPDPPFDPGQSGFLDAVSCPSSTFCASAGGTQDTFEQTSLAEFWDGTTWTLLPEDFSDTSPLFGASCAVDHNCLAVGYTVHTGALQLPLSKVLTPTGGANSLFPATVDDPPDEADSLNAVSCLSETVCLAVGSTTAPGRLPLLVERLDGFTWSLLTPAGATAGSADFQAGSSLDGISCTSASSCVAVGSAQQQVSQAGEIETTLAEQWDGSAWSLDATPNPDATQGAELRAVSCPSPGACDAVGDGRTSTTEFPIAERLHRGRWSVMNLPPVPATAIEEVLSGISCPTIRNCTAVGFWLDSANNPHPVALRLHGARWQLQTIPAVPNTTGGSLAAVSCPSRHLCTAVGYELLEEDGVEIRQQPLVEHWAGRDRRRPRHH
ncbi:MAG TPA: hypothetical protein VGG07_05180 [Solirubrobacteraceae bacterium]|jgi:hypothetical protein